MNRAHRGFTLIEVTAAVVIFLIGVLAVVNLSGAMSRRLERAAVGSELASRAVQQLDSIQGLPYTTVVPGFAEDTIVVRGRIYWREITVEQFSPLLRSIEVSLSPDADVGPSHTLHGFLGDRW